MTKLLKPVLVGCISVLITCLPLLKSGFFVPHDFTHAGRIVEMNRALHEGQFPVRWSDNFGFGYGMPLFHFYAPLPYYIAQVPYELTHDAILSIKILYVLTAGISFAGMYILGKRLWGEEGALVSAIVCAFSTYRALDMYVRGDMGELFSMAFLPFALYGMLVIPKKQILGMCVTACSLSLILLSHNLSGMIAIIILVIWGLGQILLERNIRLIVPLIFSGILAGLLSAFYILPAFFEKSFTRVEQTITTGYFDYHNHFVALRQFFVGRWGYGGSVPGLEDGISFALGWIPIILFVGSLSLFGYGLCHPERSWYPKKSKDSFILSVVLFCLMVFMASNRSTVIWDHLPILKFMQFPWRFLEFAHVFLAICAGGLGLFVSKKKIATPIILMIFLAFTVTQARFFNPEKILPFSQLEQYYSTTPTFIRQTLSKTLNDYLPPAIQDSDFPAPVSERFAQWGTTVRVNVFQFPGWEAKVDGKKVDLIPDPTLPIYLLTLPTKTSQYSVQLEDTPIRKASNIMSGIGVLVFASFCVYYYGRRTS